MKINLLYAFSCVATLMLSTSANAQAPSLGAAEKMAMFQLVSYYQLNNLFLRTEIAFDMLRSKLSNSRIYFKKPDSHESGFFALIKL